MPLAVSDIKTINEGGVEQIETIKGGPLVAQTPESLHYKPITEEEKALDRRINWKLDICVASVLSTGFILCGIDKTNVSYVSTSSFIQDANISANAVATSLTLFSATYVPLQPISALAARRVGAKYWLAILLITWGAFCMAHAAIKNEATFMALRLLLGATESGFMPVGFYFMSLVYPKYALGFRAGCFSGMYSIAGAFAGLIAYGLLKVGSSHIKGWQVLFLFEGGLTVLTGFITLLVLPKNLETAWFLTPLERQHAVNRMHRDNMAFWNPESDMQQDSESKNGSITLRDITDVLKDWKKMLIILFNILAILPVTAFTTFLPQMVEGMGYQGVKATVMSVPPFIVGTVGLLVMVWSSDRFKERSLHTVAGMSLALIGCIVMVTSTDPRLRYGFSHVCLAGTFVAGPLVAVWLAGNTPLGGSRSFVLGLNGFTNIAGVIAGQIFNARYAPSYKVSLIITMILIAVGMVGMLFVRLMYQMTNRWRARKIVDWDEAQINEEKNSHVRRGDQQYTYFYGY